MLLPELQVVLLNQAQELTNLLRLHLTAGVLKVDQLRYVVTDEDYEPSAATSQAWLEAESEFLVGSELPPAQETLLLRDRKVASASGEPAIRGGDCAAIGHLEVRPPPAVLPQSAACPTPDQEPAAEPVPAPSREHSAPAVLDRHAPSDPAQPRDPPGD